MKFQLNEKVIGQNFVKNTKFNNMSGEIIGEYRLRILTLYECLMKVMCYEIKWSNGKTICVHHHNLRGTTAVIYRIEDYRK